MWGSHARTLAGAAASPSRQSYQHPPQDRVRRQGVPRHGERADSGGDSRGAENTKDSRKSGAAFVLTKEVYDRLARESAPFDTRATTLLLSGRSILSCDIYVWLTGSMKELKHDLPVSWDWLYSRFGNSITAEGKFRRTFRNALEKVRQVYPSVRVDVTHKRLILHPSPTSVPNRPRHRHVIETGMADEH